MQIPCALCRGKHFESLRAFHLHHDIEHAGREFVCTIVPCHRSYDNWYGFRSHMISKHNAPVRPTEQNTLENRPDQDRVVNERLQIESESSLDVDDDLATDAHKTLQSFIRNEISDDFKSLVLKQADILVCKLNSRMGLPRSHVTSLIQDFSSFFSSGLIEKFKDLVFTLLVDANIPENEKNKVSSIFEALEDPFKHLSTEYLRMKHFEASGCYIPPQSYAIESRMERVKTKDGPQLQLKEVTGQFIPLTNVLTAFFKLPHVLEDVLSYQARLDGSETLSNFSQCDIWKRKIANFPKESTVLPIMLYYDDFEPNNVLGPHCEKLGGTYISLPFLPPQCQSALDNILLVSLCNADDRRIYGNKKTFQPLLNELTLLETQGIRVQKSDGSCECIFFVVGLILGDNLGLNSVCGYVESFNANYFCRICKLLKVQSENMLTEDATLIRNPESYLNDVLFNNVKETGIKEKCIFEDLPSFESPTDIGVDPFHDLLEGVCHYTMIPVLKHFQSVNPFFLENVNDRMYMFDFGIDSDNKPSSILPEILDKNKLKMTGSEMLTFVRLFGVIAGDLVKDDDPHWQLYLLLQDLVIVCFSKRLPKNIGPILEYLVKEHNELYLKLTGSKLKPKHHFLVHYSRLIDLMGPVAMLSTIRFEAKHKFLKLVSSVCCSRRNLPYTVAVKQQLSLCYRFQCNEPVVRPVMVVGSSQVLHLKDIDQFASFSLTLPHDVFVKETHLCAKWVNFYGTKYEQGMSLFHGGDDSGCPTFAKIELILIFEQQPLFICSPLYTIGLNNHVGGYEVEEITGALNWFALLHSDLTDPFPVSTCRTYDGETVIVPKHILLV